jgi:hypothetical protein
MKARSFLPGVLAVVMAVLLSATAAWAGSTRPIKFPNNTGVAVNDLHVEFVQAVEPQPAPAGPYGPFGSQSGNGTTKVDFSGGVVPAGGSATITFTSTSPRIKIKRWWWTLNGKRVGAIQGEKALAMIHFDQDALRPGEIATVNLLAMADFGRDASFTVNYSITFPNGDIQPMPLVILDVAGGQEVHQQLLSGAVSDHGIYTLSFIGVDLLSGETTEGSSTLVVDGGTKPRPPLEVEPIEPIEP